MAIVIDHGINSGWGVESDWGGMGPAREAKSHSMMSTALPKFALETNELNIYSGPTGGTFPVTSFSQQSVEAGNVISI